MNGLAARKHLAQYNVKFQPGVNEDLAATAIWGSQQLNLSPGARYDGITGIWYVGEIAIGCVLFALVMAEPVKRVSEVLQNITFPEMIRARYDLDVVGHYARPDIFSLDVDERPRGGISFTRE